MAEQTEMKWVVESRSNRSVNPIHDIEESLSPEVDEVYVEKNGNFYTICLSNEKGGALELNFHSQEFEMIKKAINRIDKEE